MNNALKQYIYAKKVTDMVKDIRKMQKYKNSKYNTIYQAVNRQFERNTLKRKPRTSTKTVATSRNIKWIKKLHKKHKASRKGSVRSIAKTMNKKQIKISTSTVYRIKKNHLKLKFVRYRRT